MTLKTLSEQSAIPTATLHRRLNDVDRGSMTLDELERIAAALGVVARVELCAARDSNPEPADYAPGLRLVVSSLPNNVVPLRMPLRSAA